MPAPHSTAAKTTQPVLNIARIAGMYGTCKCIKAYIGDVEFGDSFWNMGGSEWMVGWDNADGSIGEASFHHSINDGLEIGEAEVRRILSDAFAANYPTAMQVAA
jgi:hypothetical protein